MISVEDIIKIGMLSYKATIIVNFNQRNSRVYKVFTVTRFNREFYQYIMQYQVTQLKFDTNNNSYIMQVSQIEVPRRNAVRFNELVNILNTKLKFKLVIDGKDNYYNTFNDYKLVESDYYSNQIYTLNVDKDTLEIKLKCS